MIQVKTQIGKSPVAGIGKGLGEILVPVYIAVVTADGIISVSVYACTVELIGIIVLRMFPDLLQSRNDLKVKCYNKVVTEVANKI